MTLNMEIKSFMTINMDIKCNFMISVPETNCIKYEQNRILPFVIVTKART